MKVSDFDYPLRPELIAQHPIANRDQSRLMVLNRYHQTIEHRHFYDIIDYLQPSDVLVINETKVLPARLYGYKKTDTAEPGAKVEFLLLKQLEPDTWEVMVRPGRRVRPGDTVVFQAADDAACVLEALVLEATPSGERIVKFSYEGIFQEVLSRLGEMPLPPYIKEKLQDQSRYQTVYAREDGSAAAPTAGLHFTPELLKKIEAMGVRIARIVLHVGIGTFRPVKEDEVSAHKMHTEYYYISEENAAIINQARASGGRVIAVGTTSTRCLESVAAAGGLITPGAGWTDIFIYPGYHFKAIDALITNFHLPKSTLLMLVSALAGQQFVLQAYQEAQDRNYRFFSFGDAMFIG